MMIDARKDPTWQVTRTTRSRARALRRDLTDCERTIWSAIRTHRLNGFAFRRQTPIGPYIADFVCHQAHLVIEIDGGQHYGTQQVRRDERRDAFLAAKGFRVLRFSNHDVMTNRSGVLETIAGALDQAPSPTLPRKRGREQSRASGKSES